jgi:hypothetical protein
MSDRASQAGHHIFWLNAEQKLVYFGLDPDLRRPVDPRRLDLWSLRRKFERLRIFLDIWGRPLEPSVSSHGSAESVVLRRVLAQLANRQLPARQTLQRVAILAMSSGVSQVLQRMQRHAVEFAPALTPQYASLLKAGDWSLPRRSELLLHGCQPDLYLWTPPRMLSQNRPRKLLVCFCTRSNTLNAPLPLAHSVLARRGAGILYVYNRARKDPFQGLAKWDLASTVTTIRRVVARFGFQQLYGLGTSLGGYAACSCAGALGLERVLNFSGYVGKAGVAASEVDASGPADLQWMQECDLGRILTVLSRNDSTDEWIRGVYDENGFVTRRQWVDSATHGSFTAAWLEGRLNGYLDWLLEGKEPSEVLLPAALSPASASGS